MKCYNKECANNYESYSNNCSTANNVKKCRHYKPKEKTMKPMEELKKAKKDLASAQKRIEAAEKSIEYQEQKFYAGDNVIHKDDIGLGIVSTLIFSKWTKNFRTINLKRYTMTGYDEPITTNLGEEYITLSQLKEAGYQPYTPDESDVEKLEGIVWKIYSKWGDGCYQFQDRTEVAKEPLKAGVTLNPLTK